MISIDGKTWPVPCDIEREAQMTPSDISGVMLDGTYFNDVIGTYMAYDVTMAVPPYLENEYDTLYESLTDPVESHTFLLPHGSHDQITIVGRVESVKDVLLYTVSQKQYWKGIKFQIQANVPTKQEDLGTVIEKGRANLPSPEFQVGSIIELADDGWDYYVPTQYTDADEVYY